MESGMKAGMERDWFWRVWMEDRGGKILDTGKQEYPLVSVAVSFCQEGHYGSV